jgi:hypothetical protein
MILLPPVVTEGAAEPAMPQKPDIAVEEVGPVVRERSSFSMHT